MRGLLTSSGEEGDSPTETVQQVLYPGRDACDLLAAAQDGEGASLSLVSSTHTSS